MTTARFAVGTKLRVMARVRSEKEVCSLGCSHEVYYHEVRIIRVTEVLEKFITALHYTHDGWGHEYRAVDSKGQVYTAEDSWEGEVGWKRGQAYFSTRPFLTPAKDLNGNLITRP